MYSAYLCPHNFIKVSFKKTKNFVFLISWYPFPTLKLGIQIFFKSFLFDTVTFIFDLEKVTYILYTSLIYGNAAKNILVPWLWQISGVNFSH